MERLQAPENLGEFPKLPIYYLAERLHFVETTELTTLRNEAIDASKSDDPRRIALAEAYHDAAIQIVDDMPDEQRNSARIGLNIAEALIRKDAGRSAEYIMCLEWIDSDLRGLIGDGQTEYEMIATIVQEAIDEERDDQRSDSSS